MNQVPNRLSVTRIYSNIRIIFIEYCIFEYEYSIFLFWIYSVFVFGQVAKNEYIRYSYSVRLLETNIFDIRIRLAFWIWIYSIFVFGENIIYKYIRIRIRSRIWYSCYTVIYCPPQKIWFSFVRVPMGGSQFLSVRTANISWPHIRHRTLSESLWQEWVVFESYFVFSLSSIWSFRFFWILC